MSVLLLAIFLFVPVLLLLTLILRLRKRPFQFSLRGLFIALTIVALVLSGIGWWRMANLAHVRWLDPASPEATSLFPLSTIVQNDDGDWSTVYQTQCRTLDSLSGTLMAAFQKMDNGYRSEVVGKTLILVTGKDREVMEAFLAAMKDADKLGPGEMVLRGRVENSDGMPVAGAIVDLMGPYVFINHFRTREDGTFVMPMTPTEGWGYYLRIRPSDGQRRNTARFSLSYDQPERVVIVRLP